MLAEPKWDNERKRRLRTEYVIVAYLAGRMDVAKEQYKLLEGRLDESRFEMFPVDKAEVLNALGTPL
ncbi:MAG: hypothetical protein U1D30_11085 [Planctomycetota bacterium]